MKGLLPVWLLVCLTLLAAACHHDDDDDLDVPELIVGTWTVDSYEVLGDPDTHYEVHIDRFEFRSDQTFTVYYAPHYDPAVDDMVTADPEGGTYEAGTDYLRLEYHSVQGDVQKVLCEILSFTQKSMQLTYRHPDSDISVNVSVVKQ